MSKCKALEKGSCLNRTKPTVLGAGLEELLPLLLVQQKDLAMRHADEKSKITSRHKQSQAHANTES